MGGRQCRREEAGKSASENGGECPSRAGQQSSRAQPLLRKSSAAIEMSSTAAANAATPLLPKNAQIVVGSTHQQAACVGTKAQGMHALHGQQGREAGIKVVSNAVTQQHTNYVNIFCQ